MRGHRGSCSTSDPGCHRRLYLRRGGANRSRAVTHRKDYLIASHCSVEIGHKAILKYLGLKPILDLELQTGRGHWGSAGHIPGRGCIKDTGRNGYLCRGGSVGKKLRMTSN